MRYKEFNQIELSHVYNNGKRQRNKIINYVDVNKYFGMNEIHTSVGRFKNLIQYMKENNGSISGIDHSPVEIFYDYIIIDYDELDTRPLINFLSEIENIFDILLQNICIYFSGNKGFHVYIPSVLCGITPSIDLNMKVKSMVKELTKDHFEADLNIYRKGSTIRLPHTRNAKSGLYKIPIYTNELNDIEGVKRMAKAPRYEKTFIYPDYSSFKFTEYFKSIKISNESIYKNKKYENKRNESDFVKKCIINMLNGVSKDERGGRKNVAFRLAVHFAEQQLPPDITESVLFKWNEKNSPPLPYSVIQSVIKSAYRNEYSFGCNDPVKNANCESNCFLYKYKTNK